MIFGLCSRTWSTLMPSRPRTPGSLLVRNTSQVAMSLCRMSSPSGERRSSARLFLPRFECSSRACTSPAMLTTPVAASPRMASPRSTCSILMISAPQSASSAEAAGTNVCSATSRTRTPARMAVTKCSYLLGGSAGSGDGDGLQLEVAVEALAPHLPADAARLDAAERCGRIHAVGLVDAEGPGADPARKPEPSLAVARPHRSRQPVVGVVRDAYGSVVIGLVVVRDDREDGAEDLLLRDPHPVVDVGEQRGCDVPAAVETVGHLLPADHEPCAFVLAGGDVAAHPLLLALSHQRAD